MYLYPGLTPSIESKPLRLECECLKSPQVILIGRVKNCSWREVEGLFLERACRYTLKAPTRACSWSCLFVVLSCGTQTYGSSCDSWFHWAVHKAFVICGSADACVRIQAFGSLILNCQCPTSQAVRPIWNAGPVHKVGEHWIERQSFPVLSPEIPCKDQETLAVGLGGSSGPGFGDNHNSFCCSGQSFSHPTSPQKKREERGLSFKKKKKKQGLLRVKLHNSLFIFKVRFLVAIAEKDKLIPHVASRQKLLCVPGEAHAAGVWVSGQSPQGKHGLEGLKRT